MTCGFPTVRAPFQGIGWVYSVFPQNYFSIGLSPRPVGVFIMGVVILRGYPRGVLVKTRRVQGPK